MPSKYKPGGSKNRNKQGARSQPLRAWKEIAEAEYQDALRHGGIAPRLPAAITRPLTKTGRPRKRINTQAREQRNETRRRNKTERAAQSEHERRSQAAKKGWDKIGKRERTERALKGWDTRDRQRGVRPEHRSNQHMMEHEIELENKRRRVPSNPYGRFPRGDDPNHPMLRG